MGSYLHSWLPTLSLQQSDPTIAVEEESSNPISIEDADDDTPPAFPAIESAQRISSASASKLLSPSSLMPPPPLPAPRIPGPPAPSSLMPPPSTTKPPTQLSKTRRREKVALAPGHSALDWAALKDSGADLRVCLPWSDCP
jgi:hypothetical protein